MMEKGAVPNADVTRRGAHLPGCASLAEIKSGPLHPHFEGPAEAVVLTSGLAATGAAVGADCKPNIQ